MPIWDIPEGAVDVRCPGAHCARYLIEVAPEVYQCWNCLTLSRSAYAFSNLLWDGRQYQATVISYEPIRDGFRIGDAKWQVDQWGYPLSWRGFHEGKMVDLAPEDEEFAPLPVTVRPWPPEQWPTGLEKWDPQWRFQALLGRKELHPPAERRGRSSREPALIRPAGPAPWRPTSG